MLLYSPLIINDKMHDNIATIVACGSTVYFDNCLTDANNKCREHNMIRKLSDSHYATVDL